MRWNTGTHHVHAIAIETVFAGNDLPTLRVSSRPQDMNVVVIEEDTPESGANLVALRKC
jgi:hypothetical protein